MTRSNYTTACICGEYEQPGVAASGLRLQFALDGTCSLEKWLDLGAKWGLCTRGRYFVTGATISLRLEDRFWPDHLFADGLLHIREITLRNGFDETDSQRRIVLVPTTSIPKLDDAISRNDPNLDRLEFAIAGCEMFFQPGVYEEP